MNMVHDMADRLAIVERVARCNRAVDASDGWRFRRRAIVTSS
jgi:hypothetical protein